MLKCEASRSPDPVILALAVFAVPASVMRPEPLRKTVATSEVSLAMLIWPLPLRLTSLEIPRISAADIVPEPRSLTPLSWGMTTMSLAAA